MNVNHRASTGKMGLMLFFDYRGALLVEFIHRKKRINSYNYIDTLMRLYNQIKHKQLSVLTLQPRFLHNNARPHTTVTPSGMLESLKWDSMEQQPYSPDFALANFRIFGPFKKDLTGLRFFINKEVQEWVTKWLHQLGHAEWKKAIFEMPVRW